MWSDLCGPWAPSSRANKDNQTKSAYKLVFFFVFFLFFLFFFCAYKLLIIGPRVLECETDV